MMRVWNWAWTLLGVAGIGLGFYKLYLIRQMHRVARAKGINGDTEVLMRKARRDNLFRLFKLCVLTAAGVVTLSRPLDPPDDVPYLAMGVVAATITFALALDIRDRLRLMHGYVLTPKAKP